MNIFEISTTAERGFKTLPEAIAQCRLHGESLNAVMQAYTAINEGKDVDTNVEFLVMLTEAAKNMVIEHQEDVIKTAIVQYIEEVRSVFAAIQAVAKDNAEALSDINTILSNTTIDGVDMVGKDVLCYKRDWLYDAISTFTDTVTIESIMEAVINGYDSGENFESVFSDISDELETLDMMIAPGRIITVEAMDIKCLNDNSWRTADEYNSATDDVKQLLEILPDMDTVINSNIVDVLSGVIFSNNDIATYNYNYVTNIVTMLELISTIANASVQIPLNFAIGMTKLATK